MGSKKKYCRCDHCQCQQTYTAHFIRSKIKNKNKTKVNMTEEIITIFQKNVYGPRTSMLIYSYITFTSMIHSVGIVYNMIHFSSGELTYT